MSELPFEPTRPEDLGIVRAAGISADVEFPLPYLINLQYLNRWLEGIKSASSAVLESTLTTVEDEIAMASDADSPTRGDPVILAALYYIAAIGAWRYGDTESAALRILKFREMTLSNVDTARMPAFLSILRKCGSLARFPDMPAVSGFPVDHGDPYRFSFDVFPADDEGMYATEAIPSEDTVMGDAGPAVLRQQSRTPERPIIHFDPATAYPTPGRPHRSSGIDPRAARVFASAPSGASLSRHGSAPSCAAPDAPTAAQSSTFEQDRSQAKPAGHVRTGSISSLEPQEQKRRLDDDAETRSLGKYMQIDPPQIGSSAAVRFEVHADVAEGAQVYVIGDLDQLGSWKPAHAMRLLFDPIMSLHAGSFTRSPKDEDTFEFKLLVRQSDGSFLYERENNGNRVARFDSGVISVNWEA